MPRADPTPDLGTHVASLNLFQESDGSYHITVAGGGSDRPVADLLNRDPTVENAMQALAVMIDEAGPRFVRCWRRWRRGR